MKMNSTTYTEEKLYTCIKCKEELPLDLDPKILEIVGGSLLCNACSKTHLVEHNYSDQIQIPSEDNSISDTDNKAFSAEVSLNLHTVEKVYHCEICSQTFSRVADLCMHLQPLFDEKLSICEVCQKTFGTRTELKRHYLTHTKEKPYVCTVCDKAFTRFYYLRVHSRLHTKKKVYTCDVCKKTFSEQSKLKMHTCLHTEQKPYIKCSECPAAFTHTYSLERHSISHTGKQPIICEVCDKVFKDRGSLKQHMLFHTGEKPFVCHLCDRTYTRRYYLTNHMRYHTGEKPYVCHVCNSAFAQRFQIKAHSCKSEKQENNRSSECTTIYIKSPTLAVCNLARAEEKYVTVDDSEEESAQCCQLQEQKSYICSECKTTFSTIYDLKLHLRTHAEEKTFECDLCKKNFWKRSNLKLHQWRCHALDWNHLKNSKNKD